MKLTTRYGKGLALMLLAALLAITAGCGSKPEANAAGSAAEKATYKLDISGTLAEEGVISYAGQEMNVYEDETANPCGECTHQLVSVLKGDDGATVAAAIAKAVGEDEDTPWQVLKVEGASVTLVEKEAGAADKPKSPSAPKGLTIKGTYDR